MASGRASVSAYVPTVRSYFFSKTPGLNSLLRLDWPVRTVSFSHDGKLLASASEDLLIDIADVASGEKVAEVPVSAATFTVAWHPKHYLLAYACDDKQERKGSSSSASVKLFGCYGAND